MTRYILALTVLISAATAMAGLPQDQNETTTLNKVGQLQKPAQSGMQLVQSLSPLSSTQETALHRLIKSGCAAGHHDSFYGYPMECKGQPVPDTTAYVNLIFAEQVCKDFGGCN